MSKDEFAQLLHSQLNVAAQNAESRFGIEVPRAFKIRLHPRGTPRGSRLHEVSAVLDELYGDGSQFPLYVDMAVEAISISRSYTIVYVSVDKRDKVPFEMTWNYETGGGPFKQQINAELHVVPD